MPPSGAKAAGAGTAAEAPADAPVKEAVADKKDKKVPRKDKAEGTMTITSFFTRRPPGVVGAPATPAPAAAPAAPAAASSAASPAAAAASRADECVLVVDSDGEGQPGSNMTVSNTPPTASKRSEAGKKEEAEPGREPDGRPGGGSAEVGALGAASPAKGPDAKAKAEGKKKGGRAAKAESKDAKAKEEVAKGRQGTLCFQPCLAPPLIPSVYPARVLHARA